MLETLQSLQPKAILVNKGHFIALRLGYLQDFLMISSFKIVPQGGDACKICEQCFFNNIFHHQKKSCEKLNFESFMEFCEIQILSWILGTSMSGIYLSISEINLTALLSKLSLYQFLSYLLFAEMRSFPGIFDWERMLSRWPHSSSTTLPVKS